MTDLSRIKHFASLSRANHGPDRIHRSCSRYNCLSVAWLSSRWKGFPSVRILILGGDGFCGWPTALHLSAAGHQVAIVDNLSRRNIDNELEVSSLTPISPMGVRLDAWKELTGHQIDFHRIDVAQDYDRLLNLLGEYTPDVVVHFAEQRAAPYSMKSSWHKRYTVNNNLNATNNVLAAIVESGQDIHVVHLGTMGVYGYGSAGMKIPEGYLRVKVETEAGDTLEQEILYPANPGSIYHLTRISCSLRTTPRMTSCGLLTCIRASCGEPKLSRPSSMSG